MQIKTANEPVVNPSIYIELRINGEVWATATTFEHPVDWQAAVALLHQAANETLIKDYDLI